ncbi:Gfo/Idh/MocA family protein [Stieleria marina]|uniref:Putative oxidoreductase YvaA n=1 Tax=Stieleria marina TaxID=1930275 RepID=A0A517P088_9BACT|nr:putative oxidoreductase YvaA [Planctomycetes bacterium K23_9]
MLAGGAIAAGNAAIGRSAHAFGSDAIKIGVVGCGRRGIRAALEALNTGAKNSVSRDAPGERIKSGRDSASGHFNGRVELVAMADAFNDNLHRAYRTIKGHHTGCVQSGLPRHCGLDGFRGVMNSDADVVILATPPAFRPAHFEAAIDAGKHVFMEKPVAADFEGVRRVMAAGRKAEEKGLAVQVGFQRRHDQRYQETIAQLRGGIIDDVLMTRAYCNTSQVSLPRRRASESELEYQIRNWSAFDWLGGDLFVEHHVQNLDVINWLMDAHPEEASGQGGQTAFASLAQSRSDDQGLSGDADLFHQQMVEFTYAGGAKLLSQSRRSKGCWNKVGEFALCAGGSADIAGAKIYDRSNKLIWKSDAVSTKGSGWQVQQDNFFAALRQGKCPNETASAAESTMTALLGRIASQRGQSVTWDEATKCQESHVRVESLVMT